MRLCSVFSTMSAIVSARCQSRVNNNDNIDDLVKLSIFNSLHCRPKNYMHITNRNNNNLERVFLVMYTPNSPSLG